jgi:hypothetical protein
MPVTVFVTATLEVTDNFVSVATEQADVRVHIDLITDEL